MPGTCTELSPGFNFAALADVAAKPGDVLVVNMPDVVDAERADLPSGGVPAPTGASASGGGTTWTAAVTIAIAFPTLALGSSETRSLRAALL